MSEIEQRLLEALNALSEHVEGLEGRLSTMTENYRILSRQIEGISKRINQSESANWSLLEQLRSLQEQQSSLIEPLEQLQKQLGTPCED